MFYYHGLSVAAKQTSLTVDNVLAYLYPLSDQWVTVANKLHLSANVIYSIQASHASDHASLKMVVEWWFQNTANPEWNTIVQLQGMWQHGSVGNMISTAHILIYIIPSTQAGFS